MDLAVVAAPHFFFTFRYFEMAQAAQIARQQATKVAVHAHVKNKEDCFIA
jgi:hypothetical protein